MQLAIVQGLCEVIKSKVSFFLILELRETAVKLVDFFLFEAELFADSLQFLIFKLIVRVQRGRTLNATHLNKIANAQNKLKGKPPGQKYESRLGNRVQMGSWSCRESL